MTGRRPVTAGLVLAALFFAGCAQPPLRPTDPAAQIYSGRIALQVQDDPSQSLSASFELQGNASAGELTLSSPLGIAAILGWTPTSATLRQGGQVREFASLEALAAQASGTPLPVAALFDWLRGVDTPAPGWETDLSQLAEGRLRAKRTAPLPVADLRVVLER